MKNMYDNHYDKAIVPMYVALYEMGDYMSEDECDALSSIGFEGVKASVTLVREPAEPDCGILSPDIKISDVDVESAPVELVLFRDVICKAAADYIYDNEDQIAYGHEAKDAFDWMDYHRTEIKREAC